MESATVWNVRFKLTEGGYTFSRVSCKGDKLYRHEVQQWADIRVRKEARYEAVDDIYPVEGAE